MGGHELLLFINIFNRCIFYDDDCDVSWNFLIFYNNFALKKRAFKGSFFSLTYSFDCIKIDVKNTEAICCLKFVLRYVNIIKKGCFKNFKICKKGWLVIWIH